MTDKELLLGNLFREALYNGVTVPEIMESFSNKISKNFKAEDFLVLQMSSQLYESAQIRKQAHEYMKMMSQISAKCFTTINLKYPSLHFCTSQRFKTVLSELYKRYERIQDGLSPEIKDLPALRIILLEPETQETLQLEYLIVQDILETFSTLNSQRDFPLYVNLSVPDKLVTKSDFNPEEHPEVLIPMTSGTITTLSRIGKDYLSKPKKEGYQSFHLTFELVQKTNPAIRIFAEIQVRTITQHLYAEYGPANHENYKNRRNQKLHDIFHFDKSKLHISGYYPNEDSKLEKDYSGFSKPTFVTERSKTF